jgi:hypothetical protein
VFAGPAKAAEAEEMDEVGECDPDSSFPEVGWPPEVP